jgi:hypothetical protein
MELSSCAWRVSVGNVRCPPSGFLEVRASPGADEPTTAVMVDEEVELTLRG